jgi:hypothetical protein
VIFDGYAPNASPGVPSLFIAPQANESHFPFRVKGEVKRPFFDSIVRDHPLLRQVSLREVNIARARLIEPLPGDQVVAGARNAPLIVTGQRAGHAFVALSFDLRESDLPLRVAWPLLLTHAIDALRQPDLGYRAGLTVGSQQRLPLTASVPEARIEAPGRAYQVLPVHDRTVWLRPLRAGFYAIETAAEQQLWAANRDPRHSVSIRPHQLSGARRTPPDHGESYLPRDAWAILLGLAWLVVCLEWLSYQRRWTV